MFRDRFWLSLLLTVPVVFYAHMIQMWFGYTAPHFPGSNLITPVLGTVIFLYGGGPFLVGAVRELRDRQPGMMLLIGMAITVAFVASMTVSRSPVFAERQMLGVRMRSSPRQIAHQHHIADGLGFDKAHPPVRPARVAGGVEESRRAWLSDDDRGDGQLDLVGEPVGEERSMHSPAAFDHEPADAAVAEVVEQLAEVDLGAEGDDLRQPG